jgi:antitoxin component of RelBE/YafQ-DinJ toxin-antitoxin module
MTRKAKVPPGRRKADADRRDTLIKVLVNADERDRFQAAADQMGVSLSTWMRLTAAGAVISK